MPVHTPAPPNAAMVSIGPNDLYRVTSAIFSSVSLAAGATTGEVVIPAYGYSAATCLCSITDSAGGGPVAGTLKLQRYADLGGKVPQGLAQSLTLGTNPTSVLNVLSDGAAFQALGITLTNTSPVAGVISAFELLMHAVDAPASVNLNLTGAVASFLAAMPVIDASTGAMLVKDFKQSTNDLSPAELQVMQYKMLKQILQVLCIGLNVPDTDATVGDDQSVLTN